VQVLVNRALAARGGARRARWAVSLQAVEQLAGLRLRSAGVDEARRRAARLVGPGAGATGVGALVAREHVDEHALVAFVVRRAVAAAEAQPRGAGDRDSVLRPISAREGGAMEESGRGRQGGEGSEGSEDNGGDHGECDRKGGWKKVKAWKRCVDVRKGRTCLEKPSGGGACFYVPCCIAAALATRRPGSCEIVVSKPVA
jgi:hypothetical protein